MSIDPINARSAARERERSLAAKATVATAAGFGAADFLFDRGRILAAGPGLALRDPGKLPLWATELVVTGEPTNDIVPNTGGWFNGWKHAFRLGNAVHGATTVATLAIGAPNLLDAVSRRGPRGLYDDQGGRTGVVGALGGAVTLNYMRLAAAAGERDGVKARLLSSIGHHSLGEWRVVGPAVAASLTIMANELGAFDNLDSDNSDSLPTNLRQALGNGVRVLRHPTEFMDVLDGH